MSSRILSNGTIIFPHRGNPPTVPYGYEASPGDPYVLIRVEEPCDHRVEVNFVKPCGKISCRRWCKLHDKEATPDTCEFCPDEVFTPIIDSSILDTQGEIDVSDPKDVSGQIPESEEGTDTTVEGGFIHDYSIGSDSL